ncbi:MAG: T9SS type A sorting domain-containing protein [Bacteroidales bacterium]|nr:T9SS type A sorting domain-containing protein [Bacteroidales bacterium]
MKTKYFIPIKRSVILACFILHFGEASMAQLNYCQPNPPSIPASCASQIGNSTIASGNSSFAAGQFTEANGISSVSIGHSSVAEGHYSISLGQSCFSGSQSYSIGQNAKANGQQSFAIGRYVETSTTSLNSFIIGSGSSEFIMQNNISNSLMIGFNSSVPTFFIGPSSGSGSGIGMIGIGTSYPLANIHIKSLVNENAVLFLETGSWNINNTAAINLGNIMHGITADMNNGLTFRTQKNYIFNEGKIGIGTANPVCRLQVADGDIFIQDINKGIIMKSPDGSCWRGTMNDSGQLIFEKLDDCETLITKTDEKEDLIPVSFFPNPAKDFIEINCAATEIEKYQTISIYNSAGQQVLSQSFNKNTTRISTAGLIPGTYILKLSGQGYGYADVVVIAR